MDGECKIVYSNGDYYNGQIKNNKLIGNGKCKKTFIHLVLEINQ